MTARPDGTCPSGKFRFATWDRANRALTDAKIARAFHRNNRRREERAYACDRCGGWHLTSMQASQALTPARAAS